MDGGLLDLPVAHGAARRALDRCRGPLDARRPARRVTGDQTLFFEFLRIEERPGGIYYIAHPKARPGVEFKLVACRRGEARFENPEHDYPRSILYRRNPEGTIYVRLEGMEEGRPLTEEFVYRPRYKK